MSYLGLSVVIGWPVSILLLLTISIDNLIVVNYNTLSTSWTIVLSYWVTIFLLSLSFSFSFSFSITTSSNSGLTIDYSIGSNIAMISDGYSGYTDSNSNSIVY